MNPNKNHPRGCFIRKDSEDKYTLVDYPTWTFNKYGIVTARQNEPIPEGGVFEMSFKTKTDAREFARSENYIVCAGPNENTVKYDAADEYDEYDEYDSDEYDTVND